MSEPPNQIEVWCAGELWCPATATARLVGGKWHLVILQCLMNNGPLGFAALQEHIEDISSKVLAENLEELEQKHLIERAIVNEKPVRVAYSLTESGSALQPVVRALREWGSEYLMPPEHQERRSSRRMRRQR